MRVYACRVRSLEVVAGQACLPFSLHVRLVHCRLLFSVVALAPSIGEQFYALTMHRGLCLLAKRNRTWFAGC